MSHKIKNKKIAIVYDWFDKWGGVERILLILKSVFPEADFYTSYFDKKKAYWARDFEVKVSFIQKLPFFIKTNRILSIPFYPFAFESFYFDKYDLVISITSSFAKGIITKPKTKHICYLLSPSRFLWSRAKDYELKIRNFFLIKKYEDYLKKWDVLASKRPDKIISISNHIKNKCEEYYQRKSIVLYPPFDIDYWKKIRKKIINFDYKNFDKKFNFLKDRSFFLIVSRLEPYKKVDLAIKVFNQIGKNLVIIGKGTQEKKLKKIANKNILFFSDLTDFELAFFYSKAEALIMPQEEDFGYVALEAQFFNCPVITYGKGGATEILVNNKNSVFFDEQNINSLVFAIERFFSMKYNLKLNIKKSKNNYFKKFSKENFIKKILENL